MDSSGGLGDTVTGQNTSYIIVQVEMDWVVLRTLFVFCLFFSFFIYNLCLI